MEFEHILFEVQKNVGIITINIPERYNPIDINVEMEILEAFREIEADPDIKAGLITGAGDKAFSAGADIMPYRDMSLIRSFDYLKKLHEAQWTIEHLNKPTLAVINGLCLGGGFELTLGCTLRFAADHAKLGLPEVNVGCIPGNGGIQRLGRLIGKGRAMWYLLTGEVMTAEEALSMGVVNQVFPGKDLMEKSMEFLNHTLLKKSPTAVWALRKALNIGMEVDLKTASEMDCQLESICFATDDFKEGVAAFIEKRKPQFKGS